MLSFSSGKDKGLLVAVAVGLSMEKFGIGSDASYDALSAYCQNNRQEMAHVAAQVIKNSVEVDLTPYLPPDNYANSPS